VLGRIAEEEKSEVSDSEINAEIENMIKSAAENKDELTKFLNTPDSRKSIEQILITRKTIQRLVEIANGPDKSIKQTQKEEQK
jgi:FKBP-type peptidyl-prolyl cis-trans isomerase (trigger factor)